MSAVVFFSFFLKKKVEEKKQPESTSQQLLRMDELLYTVANRVASTYLDAFKAQRCTLFTSVRTFMAYFATSVLLSLIIRTVLVPAVDWLFSYDQHNTRRLVEEYRKTRSHTPSTTESWMRWAVNLLGTGWCSLLAIAFIPYSRMYHSYTWLCFHVYNINMVCTFIATRRALQKSLIRWYV